jgi:hypothetical protein
LKGGLPQGTKFGPLGFLAKFNDAVLTNPSEGRIQSLKYVDDMTIIEKSHVGDTDVIQSTLDEFCKWAKDNDMKLNPAKCVNMNVSFLQNLPHAQPLQMCSRDLQMVDKIKILGVTIASNLKWDCHISNVVHRASNKLYMLKLLRKFKLPVKDLLTIYRCYVRPLLEYAVPVWNAGITDSHVHMLERVQKRALRIILGQDYNCYSHALKLCNLTNLKMRRENICVKFARNMYESEHFRKWLPNKVSEKVQYSLRNANNISQVRCKTKRYKNSAIPYFIDLLNNGTK